ncbi:pre-rRNA-processing protein TSR2 [Marchantia polymorpha subsp. ruderalis]|uniref:Pre-rRNA-processing protein TSR2 homolog n=2 Tax=Marchantia polymorpha TaxID=3197 RepID=A0A176VDE0_MARPO|nr:hypothetical protein AXG93_1923s1530 [Marchantia polymorpha subsp. ruderalis]PTQ48508.1 hypothetical protein MARPO_0005s0148 [Marchantia polymorpha]BBM97298.1 hypothetical protein Mp_1g04590 [Marchantia polymorpha subsp. ruderalis]|eukprot:PTQ48508.1 hypothetical protein MARPO_0005s0148 [Marchantia polymorpha]
MWAPLTKEAADILGKGIFECMSRWTALQLAIQNGWGGQSSNEKCQQMYTEILSFFTCSKEQRYIDEMEDLLEQFMVENFHVEIEDGSVFEVSEQLFIVHEECVNGNFENVKQMFATASGSGAAKSKELPTQEGENPPALSGASSSGEDDDEMEDMEDDILPASAPSAASSRAPKVVQSNLTQEEMADGWQEAPARTRRRSAAR